MSRLDQIRDRLQHASPGPWTYECTEDRVKSPDFDDAMEAIGAPPMPGGEFGTFWRINGAALAVVREGSVHHHPDGDLIANAPDDLVYLLACVDGLREALGQLIGSCETVAWTNSGKGDYWSFVPADRVAAARAELERLEA